MHTRWGYGILHLLILTISVSEVRYMSGYEFSLRQEVLLEKGASVLSDLF